MRWHSHIFLSSSALSFLQCKVVEQYTNQSDSFYSTTDSFMTPPGFEFSIAPSGAPWNLDVSQHNVPLFDADFSASCGPSHRQVPTAGGISHSVEARVLSPVSVASSWRSPVLAHSGQGISLERNGSQVSATTEVSVVSRSVRDNQPFEAPEFRSSISQRPHRFSSTASDVTDNSLSRLQDGALPQSPHYQVTSAPSFNAVYSASMEQFSIPVPLDFAAETGSVGHQSGNNSYGPPLVFDGLCTSDSPQDFTSVDPFYSDFNLSGPFDNVSDASSPRYVSEAHTLAYNTMSDGLACFRNMPYAISQDARQQYYSMDFDTGLSMMEGSSPSDSSQIDSIEAEKLHNTYRSDPLYKSAVVGADGLYHCPFESDAQCTHKPDKLKCNYE